MIDLDKIASAMGDLREDAVLSQVREAVAERPDSAREVLDALSRGMDIIGERFDDFEYFVGDLIFAGEVFTEAMEILLPALPATPEGTRKKKVILATVEGDLHDIGKNIVKSVLESKGLEVVDMGVNVSPAAIVRRAVAEDIRIIGLSAVLTSSVDSMLRTAQGFEAAGIRDKVTIIVGGACLNENLARRVKADFYGRTPEDTASYCMAAEG